MKRGASISSLTRASQAYNDERSNKSRGSTRESRKRSSKPSSASQSKTASEFRRGRTLTPSARDKKKHQKVELQPLSPEEQALFDEKRE